MATRHFLTAFLKPLALAAALSAAPCFAIPGLANDSVYSKIDDAACRWDAPGGEEEEGVDGGCATCDGHGGYIVRLCEGDLRQSVYYGQTVPEEMGWNSFGQFNHAGPTVEWRLSGGVPVAAIHRFFLSNMNDAGDIDPKREGQVLVISTVARPDSPLSCPVGYVDARANGNANVLARQVADDIAPGFRCGTDLPAFYGKRGPHAGDPTGLNE